MAYPLAVTLQLGTINAGLTLKAQLLDMTLAPVGAPITTGFSEIAGGTYRWAAVLPTGSQGWIDFYRAADIIGNPGVLPLFTVSVNPSDELASMIANGRFTADALNLAPAGNFFGEAGALTFDYTVTAPDGVTPLSGVAIWISADPAGMQRSDIQVSDSVGRVRFHVNPGPIYVWRLHPDFEFDDPDLEVAA